MALSAPTPLDRPATSLEPPLGPLAAAAATLFVAGLVVSTVQAGGNPFPSPFGAADDALAYFRDHPGAVRTGAVLQFASAIPLTLYVAAATARVRRLTDGFPAALTTVGGTLAAAFLLCSGVVNWVLTVPEVATEPALLRAAHTLAFLFGGPGNVVATGLFIAGIALSAWPGRRVARWLLITGLVIAVIALCTTASLAVTGAAFLLPIARFTGMAWLIAVGFLLPRA
ncbi:hypothetical protein DFR70_10387 [Nocardia tenerifensis]|uniref:DUF4386 domain-containing protein n=1 Tax=Nocardia tenerifensis TaxID=228006 RepID=A0A318K4K8_9NOCA|nr:hypothetical protein [Nocardia tenerifensis]PXX66340.1 hypothetical protein DFR70_10387 [Nocardia tenerifensis]